MTCGKLMEFLQTCGGELAIIKPFGDGYYTTPLWFWWFIIGLPTLLARKHMEWPTDPWSTAIHVHSHPETLGLLEFLTGKTHRRLWRPWFNLMCPIQNLASLGFSRPHFENQHSHIPVLWNLMHISISFGSINQPVDSSVEYACKIACCYYHELTDTVCCTYSQ